MNKICIIPARGGSKRIPRKNIKVFCGLPMIARSIQAAKNSEVFHKIIVSTDDREIADIALSYGAEVPFMRPDHLSDDYTGTVEVIQHAISEFENQCFLIEAVCCLYATAPFVDADDLRKSCQLLTPKTDFVVPVTTFPFPIQRAVKKENNFIVPFSCDDMAKRSQDLIEAFHDAGQFYWGHKQAWHNTKNLWSQHIIPYEMPRYKVQDIDTIEDWQHAEYLFQTLRQKSLETA